MKYMILTYESENAFGDRDSANAGTYWGAWSAYGKALAEAGALVNGAGLKPPLTATTVRLRDGKRHVQDGPFADTKEQLGGYFIIDVADLDTALDWAARCPCVADGVVEVRPIIEMPAQG